MLLRRQRRAPYPCRLLGCVRGSFGRRRLPLRPPGLSGEALRVLTLCVGNRARLGGASFVLRRGALGCAQGGEIVRTSSPMGRRASTLC